MDDVWWHNCCGNAGWRQQSHAIPATGTPADLDQRDDFLRGVVGSYTFMGGKDGTTIRVDDAKGGRDDDG